MDLIEKEPFGLLRIVCCENGRERIYAFAQSLQVLLQTAANAADAPVVEAAPLVKNELWRWIVAAATDGECRPRLHSYRRPLPENARGRASFTVRSVIEFGIFPTKRVFRALTTAFEKKIALVTNDNTISLATSQVPRFTLGEKHSSAPG